uniref:methyltransferase-like 26 isoform X3 n=1 Tax=Vespula vulgaris TaxID=7454 RepID=UPI00223BA597|nr:methyltransferase-like 26 isoform X3 [Vespula vulgaris]
MNIIHCAASHSRSTSMAAKKLIYPAAERNKDPILSVLRRYIQRGTSQKFLEISSGSGQHIAHFAPHFPQVTFYPSEYETGLLESIAAHANGFSNIKDPLKIDITTDYQTWGKLLKSNGVLFTYGPYAIDGTITPESNIQFDKSLKSMNSDWGLRELRELEKMAEENNIKLVEIFSMPSNNKVIIWKKD